jgi:predicted AAA+ superfamily ATPase
LNTALWSVSTDGLRDEVLADPAARGRLVESAVGAHLANEAAAGGIELFYWREGDREVDFVVRSGRRVTAIEVKSSASGPRPSGLSALASRFRPIRTLLVGPDGVALEEFLGSSATRWVA